MLLVIRPIKETPRCKPHLRACESGMGWMIDYPDLHRPDGNMMRVVPDMCVTTMKLAASIIARRHERFALAGMRPKGSDPRWPAVIDGKWVSGNSEAIVY